jgi:chromosome segregation protein
MGLKRLEITGFKTFPDKCLIDFPAGISAIVGPNGCGKSNIIDAIKWVMGEQSIKQLRGKSMGDVIFAGTDKRPPLNIAEVSLTLSNDGMPDRVEAAQFSELMITRRLYRTGESVYLLNKQPCRLKDIQNIFLGIGMGSRSCAIVQQGNIGAITDATPEERRAFIEEAAGVTLYKTRKNEALGKVNSANQNLLRINDLIEEIRKQMNALYRQSNKAKRFQELRQKLKEIDILVSAYHYEKYSFQIETAENLLNEFKEKGSSHSGRLGELNEMLERIKSERSEKDLEISKKRAQKSEAQREIDRIENDLIHLRNEEKRLFDEVHELENALLNLEDKNQKIRKEILEESEKSEKIAQQLMSLNTLIEKENQDFQEIRDQRNELDQQREASKKQLIALMTQKTRYQDIAAYAESSKSTLQQRLKKIQEDELIAIRKRAQLNEARAEAEQRLAVLKESSSQISAKINETQKNLKEKVTVLGSQIKAVSALINERQKIKSRYSALKKMDDSHDWYRDGVKAVMRRNESSVPETGHSGNNGIVGITGDVIEPEPGFEFALEAVLGEALQYIFVKDSDAGVDSINFLKHSNAGRSGFIPVSTFTQSPLPQSKDVVAMTDPYDLLLHHITIRPGFEKPVFSLLKDVVVVDEFEDALHIWRQSNGFREIVTKGGDIISSNGIMIGGSKEKLTGIFEKKLEIKELGRQISQLDQTLEKEQRVQNNLETEVKDLENQIQKLTVEKNETIQDVLESEKKLFSVSETLKHEVHNLEIIQLEKEKLSGEKTDLEAEITKHQTVIGKLGEEIAGLEALIKSLTEKIDGLSEQVNAFEQRQLDLKLEKTKLSAELENIASTLNRIKRFQEDGVKQAQQIQRDIQVKNSKRAASAGLIFETETSLSVKRDALSDLNAHLKNEEADYQSIIEKITQTDHSISGVRQAMDDIQEKIHQLELELSRYQLSRDNVVNNFLERYAESFAQLVEIHRDTVRSPDFSIENMESALQEYKKKIEQIGDVNISAIESYEEQKTRHDFLVQQRDDLVKALDDLQNVIKKINRVTQKLFMEMFDKINEQFQALFPKLFVGGSAWMELTDPVNTLESGVELMIHPPGKKVTRLSLLSGGEKALSAIAFIFSLFLINPSTFCLLDEIDAPLDDASIFRFNELLKIIGEKSQIIMITHNKKSMEFADMLFGVTMNESGVSKLVSVDIEKLSQKSAAPN